MAKIKVKPAKDMLIYDEAGNVIPKSGIEVENSRYYRVHIKDGSLIEVKNKKGAK